MPSSGLFDHRIFAIVSDGDVGLAMMAAWPGSGIYVMIGSGGTREAIVAACAMRCLGGELQCRPWVRHEDEAAAMREAGYDPEALLNMEQLVPGREGAVAVTGISGGGLLRGVRCHEAQHLLLQLRIYLISDGHNVRKAAC